MKKRILTIAGSDPSGGAGIQADLKAITCLGGYGMTAITALTAQNPREVRAIHQVPIDFFVSQLDAVMEAIHVDAIKTGMLPNRECIDLVADRIGKHRVGVTVIDPVVVAESGGRLIDEQALAALVRTLLPLAGLVTPNLAEASLLSGMTVSSPDDMKIAAERIRDLGPHAVLVKGGHLESDELIDILLDDSGFHEFRSERIPSRAVHGTGCTLASAIATLWAQEGSLAAAVKKAKSFLTQAIRGGVLFGEGPGTPDQTAFLPIEEARERL
jgi:hydroxymethylpyrimidine/phosphomethylpyrimidine kinase